MVGADESGRLLEIGVVIRNGVDFIVHSMEMTQILEEALMPRSIPRGAHDLLIAATARAAHRTIVTADQQAFTDLPGVATIGHR